MSADPPVAESDARTFVCAVLYWCSQGFYWPPVVESPIFNRKEKRRRQQHSHRRTGEEASNLSPALNGQLTAQQAGGLRRPRDRRAGTTLEPPSAKQASTT